MTDTANLMREAFAFGLELRHKRGCTFALPASNFQKRKACTCGRDALWKKLQDAAFRNDPALERSARAAVVNEAAKDLHDYLWENIPDILDISTHSELAGEGVQKRLQALKNALQGAA
jgi:hypothetical protein